MDIFDIGELVKKTRMERGMTQNELAEKSGVGRTRVVELENGKAYEMRYGRIVNVLNALGLDLRVVDYNAGRPVLDDLLEANENDDPSP